MSVQQFTIERTGPGRTYYDGPTSNKTDEHVRQRFFTFTTETGKLAAGVTATVMFTIDRPAKNVWPILSNFNTWQNEHKHLYSGIVGELEGKTFHLKIEASQPGPYFYEVIKVIPEYLLVFHQPIPKDGTAGGLPGLGGLSPGFHVFMLNEHSGRSTVTIFMEHTSIAGTQDVTEALRPWRKVVDAEWMPKWRQGFIDTIKKLVYEAG
jgi:hypothetical protein